ncbi:RNA polymerase sigma factor [Pseudomonas aeruginosa]|nr:RNA polymerase sigma factor [Pseudomonas aeruginosa]
MPADGEAARRADLLKAFLAQRQRMESLVSRWVGGRAPAAALVQELFLRFWRRPAAPVEELGSYLLRSARNLAIDHLRGEGSRQRQLDDWLPEQRQGEPVGPEQALEAGDQWRRVEAALRGLPERTRRIFLLNRIHGRTYAEIAQAMQLSQSAVEKHMMRALDACKASLAGPAGEQARSAQP